MIWRVENCMIGMVWKKWNFFTQQLDIIFYSQYKYKNALPHVHMLGVNAVLYANSQLQDMRQAVILTDMIKINSTKYY